MIRLCRDPDFAEVLAIINESAQAYRGVIPSDCCKEPYMSVEEFVHEVTSGVRFWGDERLGKLVGVMGIQPVRDVTLVRHAYVRSTWRRAGIGSGLLNFLCDRTPGTILVGTWADATWAIDFYRKHGFQLVSPNETVPLLRKYWTIPLRQIDSSVVLRR